MYAKLTNGLYELKKENKLYLKRISTFIWASGQKIKFHKIKIYFFQKAKLSQNLAQD